MVKVIRPEELEEYSPPGHNDVISKQLVGKGMGASKMTVSLGRISPGGLVDTHSHEHSEQCYYIIRGEITVTSVNGSTKLTEGMVFWIGTSEPHGMSNESQADALYISFTAPPIV